MQSFGDVLGNGPFSTPFLPLPFGSKTASIWKEEKGEDGKKGGDLG